MAIKFLEEKISLHERYLKPRCHRDDRESTQQREGVSERHVRGSHLERRDKPNVEGVRVVELVHALVEGWRVRDSATGYSAMRDEDVRTRLIRR